MPIGPFTPDLSFHLSRSGIVQTCNICFLFGFCLHFIFLLGLIFLSFENNATTCYNIFYVHE